MSKKIRVQRRVRMGLGGSIVVAALAFGALFPVAANALSTTVVAGATVPDELQAGENLDADQQLVSNDGQSQFIMQGDGNAVVYSHGPALWNSQTFAAGSHLVMQGDGNLVVYSPNGGAVWNSGTFDNPGAYAVMQSDGNLVIYAGGVAKWNSFAASKPAQPAVVDSLGGGSQLARGAQLASGPNVAVMQGDGNFVVYAPGHATWSTVTNSGMVLAMQTDGNAVVYDGSGRPVWNSGTAGNPGAHLVLQGDGNLVIYNGNRALWNSFAASRPVPVAQPPVAPQPPADAYYANCTDAWNAGVAPLHRGQPGYRSGLDRDNDGVACEVDPRR